MRASKKLFVAVSSAVMTTALVMPSAHAVDVPVVAGPGAYQMGYANRVVLARPEDPLVLINQDVALHTLASEDEGPDDAPWCGPLDPRKPEDPVRNPRRFKIGECPLFYSDLVVPGATMHVAGTEDLEPRVYEFYCTIHSERMVGNLFVLGEDDDDD